MKTIIALTLLAPIFAISCVGTLTPAGKDVRIAALNVPRACNTIGKIEIPIQSPHWVEIAGAKVAMRNKAGAMGANVVRWDRIFYQKTTATAFSCPKSDPKRPHHKNVIDKEQPRQSPPASTEAEK